MPRPGEGREELAVAPKHVSACQGGITSKEAADASSLDATSGAHPQRQRQPPELSSPPATDCSSGLHLDFLLLLFSSSSQGHSIHIFCMSLGMELAPVLSEKHGSDTRRAANLSGPLSLPTRASANSLSAPIRSSAGYVDSDKSKRNVVHIKGRFSVTSENFDLAKVQEIPLSSISRKAPHGVQLRKSASVGDWIVNAKPMSNSHHLKELSNSSVSSSILIPHFENLMQQTTLQQDLIVNLLSSMQQNDKADGAQSGMSSQVQTMESETVVETTNTEKERSLLVKISELQSRMITLTDELISAKLKHVQLQQELNVLYCREEIEDIRDEDNIET